MHLESLGILLLFIKLFFTVLTKTKTLCRQMEVAGLENVLEWTGTQDALRLKSLVCFLLFLNYIN